MKPVQQWINEYAESHQNPINVKIHWICVPLIMLSIIGLLANIKFESYLFLNIIEINHAGTLLIILGCVYYFFLSKKILLGMIPTSLIMLAVIDWLSTLNYPLWKISLVIFILSWVAQFYGHKIEGKKPSFFKDIQFLLIGPIWLLSKVYKKFGISY
ncbi:MAG: Mpo1-like protein [Candidatus Neomarinimicrobiota bacterium]|nr:Mpo1-like protein [Candidatus Neomarinimicrobiota bacterium]|tara:strand:- start:279 stop:749 length:471 start_codon:yes stop_codon:yes gene_type:complete